jgi:hypothetical protein
MIYKLKIRDSSWVSVETAEYSPLLKNRGTDIPNEYVCIVLNQLYVKLTVNRKPTVISRASQYRTEENGIPNKKN